MCTGIMVYTVHIRYIQHMCTGIMVYTVHIRYIQYMCTGIMVYTVHIKYIQADGTKLFTPVHLGTRRWLVGW